jgi:hypothetical protein
MTPRRSPLCRGASSPEEDDSPGQVAKEEKMILRSRSREDLESVKVEEILEVKT